MRFQMNSLKYRIIAVVFGMSIPAIVLFFFLNTYAVNKITQQLYFNNKNLMRQHMEELDTELKTATDILLEISINNVSVADFSSFDTKKCYQATLEFHVNNQNVLNRFEMIEGLVAYSTVNKNLVRYFNEHSYEFNLREAVTLYVKNNAEELANYNGQWITRKINDKWVLLSSCGNEKAVFCFWTDYELLMQQAKKWISDERDHFYFVNRSNGEFYTDLKNDNLKDISYDVTSKEDYFSGPLRKYLVSGVESTVGDFNFVNIVERRAIQKEVSFIRTAGGLLLLLVMFLGVPFILKMLNHSIFNPVDRLEQGIREVENGNLTVQIENKKSSKEMEHLVTSFNGMISEVYQLKIETYEKSLAHQKMELDYLNLQIEPHFYLNALNVMSVTAQVGDTGKICEMIDNLSSYMRYIMGNRKNVVTIREELAHVKNYLKIVESRLGSGFIYEEQVAEDLKSLMVPPLTIQTLVENSMKYAFDVYRETMINVKIEKTEKTIYICVSDNGEGFSEEYLNRFNQNLPADGNHIGLMNLRSRLQMMYGEKASIHIFNQEPHGAYTEIKIDKEGA